MGGAPMPEMVIARDQHGTKILLYKYRDENRIVYDLATDRRVCLTPTLARALAKKLIMFADREERRTA